MTLRLTARNRHRLTTLAYLGLIASLAWLTASYPLRQDLTAAESNTLTAASIGLLDKLPEPISITAYIKRGVPLRIQIAQLITRYQQHKSNISFQFVDPESQPQQARELEIGEQGAILVSYQGRSETLGFLDESTLTNALLQLANSEQRWISFLSGHGERNPNGIANFDLGQFGKELARRKITAINLDLTKLDSIPDNTTMLAIASPTVPLLAGEIDLVKSYLQNGGNLLLMTEPNNSNLKPLLDYLGLKQNPGSIADTSGKLYGLDNPSFVIANNYPTNPITRGLQLITVYPAASSFTLNPNEFKSQKLLESGDKTWQETAMQGTISKDANEQSGPLAFAYTLTRTVNNNEQRVVVIGDGDFLANSYLANVGNMDMGLRIINWLIHDDKFIDLPAKTAPDKHLELPAVAVSLMGFGFLLVMPFLLLVGGVLVWLSRRRR